ncbi:MAG: TatD family hydrolase [Deltaproteobacteria bacterium]|nr:TatD family hydrolase [Deltaproteobacteria bacterium]
MSENLSIIDGHAHINELENPGHEFEKAKHVGVKAIIGVGMDVASNRRILELAREYPGFVFPAIGYHPWEIREEEIEQSLAFVEENIGGCVALGEVGVDYKVKMKKPIQRRVFGEIIRIANRHDKPLILHCRYSHQRVLAMILEGGIRRAVFHWYNASLDLLQEILSSGYYVSATPALRNSPHHQEAMKEAPIERILVETALRCRRYGTGACQDKGNASLRGCLGNISKHSGFLRTFAVILAIIIIFQCNVR